MKPQAKNSLFSRADHATVYMYVDSVRDIEWSSGTFESLVLPQDYKRIVWAFVKAQISHSDDFDDIIKGKGTK